jgi:hypothetical protein
MIASSGWRCEASSRTVLSVISPAGTITHTARGAFSFWTNSSIDPAPVAPSPARADTTSGLTS